MAERLKAERLKMVERPIELKGKRLDTAVLWSGILFSLLFTAVIWWGGQFIADVPKLPDPGGRWYYWQSAEPTPLGQLTAWGFYALHQLIFWGIIAYAQFRKKHKYTTGLHKINIVALAVTAFFILLHFGQTQIWYDGLAQDMSSASSQNSVILLLVWVLLMENNRRGLFFGKRMPISNRVTRFARRYHAYLFSWAAIYTFWFHPMESTAGHLIGFLYMFFLLLQSCLFYTQIHINRYWTFVLEVMVLGHAVLVAMVQTPQALRMFGFGFALILVVTQIHGLGWPRWLRWALVIACFATIFVVYNAAGWRYFNEALRIPIVEYALVFLLAGILALGQWVGRKVWSRPSTEMSNP